MRFQEQDTLGAVSIVDEPRHLQGFNVRAMNADATIAEAESAADMAEIRALFGEYQQWLGVDLCFKDFAEEIDNLPGYYAPPAGYLLLARALDGAVAGGVGMWPLEPGVCEMKRLFLRPPWRGSGLGRRLAVAVVEAGQAAGYARMCLDTLPRLEAATVLYRSMGFIEAAPHDDNPSPGVLYLEKALQVPCPLPPACAAMPGAHPRNFSRAARLVSDL